MDARRAAFVIALGALLAACAPTRMSQPPPQTALGEAGFLCGKVQYTGSNPEWVPRALRDMPSDATRTLRFEYEIEYGIDDESAFDLFNPLLILGATKSKDSMYVLGVLTLEQGGKTLKDYRETITVDKSKSVFSEGETLTEMRRQGLLRLRDLIDARLAADRVALKEAGFGCK
jgi:hypothetical protein